MQYYRIGDGFYSLQDAKDFAILYRELAREKNLERIDDHIFIKPVRNFSLIIWEIRISEVLKEVSEAHFSGADGVNVR